MKKMSSDIHKITRNALLALEHSEYIKKERWKEVELKDMLEKVFDEIIELVLFGPNQKKVIKKMTITEAYRKTRF